MAERNHKKSLRTSVRLRYESGYYAVSLYWKGLLRNMITTTTTLSQQDNKRIQGFRLFSILTALLLSLLLETLDQTIVGTAMPRIIAQLHGLDRYSWVVTAYILATPIMLPILCKLSAQLGRQWFLLSGTALFCSAQFFR